MAHGELTLSVPSDNAETVGMRRPIAREDVEDLFQVLAKQDVREPSNWSRRFKNHQEKLKSGDVYQVAEVVRNLALREADRRACPPARSRCWPRPAACSSPS